MKRQFKVGDVVMFKTSPFGGRVYRRIEGEIGIIKAIYREAVDGENSADVEVADNKMVHSFLLRLHLLSTAEEMEPDLV